MLKMGSARFFLQGLTSQGIDYLLLSNFDLECQSGVVCDLDICVPECQKEIFLDYIGRRGFFERRKPAEASGHHFYISCDASLGFYLDVQYALSFIDVKKWRRYTLARSLGDFLQDRELVNGYFRPSPMDCLILYAAKCVWQKKEIKSRNIDYIWGLARSAQEQERMESIWGIDFVSQSGFDTLDDFYVAAESNIPHCSEVLADQEAMVYPGGQKGGLFVLFLGPDGVGKSSLIHGVKSLSPIKCGSLYLGMGEEGWRLPLVKYFRKNRFKIFDYLFWFFLFPLELHVRHVAAMHSGKWSIQLVDRFPGRPFIVGGVWEKIYRLVLPVPDLVVVLTGDPVVIAGRKPNETSVERTRLEFEKWDKVAKKISAPLVVIDTTKSEILDCSIAVLQEISNLRKYRNCYLLNAMDKLWG